MIVTLPWGNDCFLLQLFVGTIFIMSPSVLVYVWMYACVWRPEVSFGYLFSRSSCPVDHAGLKFTEIQLPTQCWDQRYVLPCSALHLVFGDSVSHWPGAHQLGLTGRAAVQGVFLSPLPQCQNYEPMLPCRFIWICGEQTTLEAFLFTLYPLSCLPSPRRNIIY